MSTQGTFNDPSKATFIQDPLVSPPIGFRKALDLRWFPSWPSSCVPTSRALELRWSESLHLTRYDFCALLDHMANS